MILEQTILINLDHPSIKGSYINVGLLIQNRLTNECERIAVNILEIDPDKALISAIKHVTGDTALKGNTLNIRPNKGNEMPVHRVVAAWVIE